MSNINYHIKLMSGNHLVLVEADGYETEVFMPHIVSGRITFLNVIPNRRCCQPKAKQNVGGNTFRTVLKSEQRTPEHNRFSAGNDKENTIQSLRPLAMSTPAFVGKNSMNGVRIKAGTSSLMSSNYSGESTLPTPEPVRRAAPIRKDLVGDNTLYKIPRGVKVMRLYHNSADGTPTTMGRLVSSTHNGSITQQELHNLSRMTDLSSSFRTNNSPQMSKAQYNGIVASTPLNKQPATVNNPTSVCKWRKCQTPKVTYSRRGNHTVAKHNKSISSSKKSVKPTYLVNPTMPPKPTHTMEVKKKRLKVDEHVRIPSKLIKRQQNKNNKLSTSMSKTEYLKKSLNHLGHSPMSAFDLLTNSNHKRCIANKLNEQFRKGCINKASSTYPKYRVLSSVPPMQQDEQVRELTRIEGQSFDQSVEQIDRGVRQVVSRATSTVVSVPCNSNGGSLKVSNKFAKPKTPQKSNISFRPVKTENQTRHYQLKI